MQQINNIRESKLALILKVLSLGGLTYAVGILTVLYKGDAFWGTCFAVLGTVITVVIIINWRHTGIFKEANNIRITNKSRGINVIFSKEIIERFDWENNVVIINLKGNAGVIEFPLGDFNKNKMSIANEWLSEHLTTGSTADRV